MEIKFLLNESEITIQSAPDKKLSSVLKIEAREKSVKESCMGGRCGSCLLLLDYKPVYSCLVPVISVKGRSVYSIDWAVKQKEFDTILQVFKEHCIYPCPQCSPARVLSIFSLMYSPENSEERLLDQYLQSVTCSCTSYHSYKKAVKAILKKVMHHHG